MIGPGTAVAVRTPVVRITDLARSARADATRRLTIQDTRLSWFFFGLPEKPERAILVDPERWYSNDPDAMGRANYDDYLRAINDPPRSTR